LQVEPTENLFKNSSDVLVTDTREHDRQTDENSTETNKATRDDETILSEVLYK
jgi:hypothetical protein